MAHTGQLTLAAIVAALISACNSVPVKEEPQKPDPVMLSIEQSAKVVSRSMATMSQITYATSKASKRSAKPHKWTGPLSTRITVPMGVYTLEAILKEIAKKINYKVRISGRQPANQVTVLVEANNTQVGDVVEDIGWQAGNDVGVKMYKRAKVFKIVYEGHK